MSDLGETFAVLREERKLKKRRNKDSTLSLLDEHKVEYKVLSDSHLRIAEYDFWPTTGLFIHLKTKKRGRGIFNLLKQIHARKIERG